MMKVRHAIPLYRCLCTSISRNREKELNYYTVPIVVKTLLILSFECILGLTIENSKLGCIYCGVVVMGVICGFNSQRRHVKFGLVTKPSHVQNRGT
jgi:hypothetical protein